ncbi:dynactin subunit 2-like [Ciona intestinalis]
MADPKYANLPGIDTESKDVYESGDLPEDDQHTVVEELNSTSVEVIGSDTQSAFNLFSGKYVAPIGDFSGYNAKSSAVNEEETVLQKFNRLKIEVQSLLDEVETVKESKADPASAAKLVSQVQSMQMKLSQSDVDSATGSNVEKVSDVEKLLSSLKTSFSKSKTSDSKTTDGSYQLFLKPEAEKKKSLQFSALEQRLARLEKVLGSETDDINVLAAHSKHETLQSAAQMMEAKLSLLDPEQLPLVDSRLQAILSKVNEINKAHKAAGDQTSEVNSKITELYDLMHKSEGVRSALPHLIERLKALDELHAKSSSFVSVLDHLESTQAQINGRLDTTSASQKKLQEMLQKNMETIKDNVTQLNKRIADLQK